LTLSSKNKIIIVGDLIIDNHYISDNIGRAAEYNAPKGILKKKYFQIGGAGMVLNGLMVIDKTAQLIMINTKLEIEEKKVTRLTNILKALNLWQ
jgi:bifunctional ADP-heptose synthase (sugar kinase/adenylyltransferase)